LQAHCQSPTSQLSDQSIVKELAKPTHREKLSAKGGFVNTKKIKNADTRADTERQESKMTMTRKLNNDNGLQDWKTEHQAVINKASCGRGTRHAMILCCTDLAKVNDKNSRMTDSRMKLRITNDKLREEFALIRENEENLQKALF